LAGAALPLAEFPEQVSPSYSLLPQPDDSPLESLSPLQLSELESLESPVQESVPESLELESPLHESLLDSLELESPLHESLLDSPELESPLHESSEPESKTLTVQLSSP
jgi:hypothetical protein